MAMMKEMIMHTINKSPTKTAIIGRSPRDGQAVLAFESIDAAKRYIEKQRVPIKINWFKQTVTEEAVQIEI